MNRRNFLKGLGVGAAGLGAWGDLNRIAAAASLGATAGVPKAAGEDYRALVCLFMFGGNDGNNTVIPTSASEYPQYANGRTGALALAQGTLLPITVQNASGRTFALHPAMAGRRGSSCGRRDHRQGAAARAHDARRLPARPVPIRRPYRTAPISRNGRLDLRRSPRAGGRAPGDLMSPPTDLARLDSDRVR